MIIKMYAIYDRKTEIHHCPLYAHSTGHVLRVIGDMVADPQTPFYRHPEDYQLFEIGTYDDATAHVVPNTPHLISTLSDLVRLPNPNSPDDLIPNTPTGE